MNESELLRVPTRAQWRTWLKKNHDRAREIWLVYEKAHSAKRTVTYAEAVEEAICFGWIDTTVRTIDDEHYMQRFTPRTNERNWSKINLERFARMEAEGKMTDAGRAKKPADVTPPKPRLQAGDPVPPFIAEELKKHPRAQEFFESLAPSYRRNYLRYITEAKREETRIRRLAEAIGMLGRGVKQVF
jgi:uncharacterized protein YdeI (YjbR/CyaY-like superfamily)